MSNDQPSRRPPAKSSGGGAPMGSTVAIVIAVVAVVVGFLILRNINNDSKDDSANSGNTTPVSEVGGDTTTTSSTEPPPSTTTPLQVTGATVVVANASGVGGAAGQFTTALQSVGFTTGKATNATGPDQRLDVSKVYYDPSNAEASKVAASVAQSMGAPASGVVVATMPSPVPVEGEAAGLGDATVLVMLGKDLAGKPLPILAPEGAGTTTTALTESPINSSTTTTVAG